MKKVYAVISLALCFAAACGGGSDREITFYHTNEIQGFYYPRPYASNENKPAGGPAVLKNMLLREEKEYLLFDSGDSFSKTQEGQLNKLEGSIMLMNAAGYDGATLSAGDFALGWDAVEPALQKANFPFIISNLKLRGGGSFKNIKPYVFYEQNKIKIAVLGLISKADFPDIQRNADLEVSDEIETLKTLIPKVQEEGADIIILLSSLGFEIEAENKKTDEKLLAETFPEINLILGGNADISPQGCEEISHTVITRAEPMLYSAEKIILSLNKSGQVKAYLRQSVLLDEETYGQDEQISKTADSLRAAAKRISGRKITSLKEPLDTFSDKPSPLGYYAAQCIRRWAKQDIAIINSDAFLTPLARGVVTESDLYGAMPFSDKVMFLKMRGDELKNALEHSLAVRTNWLQTAGIKLIYDQREPVGKKIKKIYINGRPLNGEALYTIAVSDHIIAGGLGHNEFINVYEFKNTGLPLRDIVRQCLLRDKEPASPALNDWENTEK